MFASRGASAADPLPVIPPTAQGSLLPTICNTQLPVHNSGSNFYVSITSYNYFSFFFSPAKSTLYKAEEKLKFVPSESKSVSIQNQKGSSMTKGSFYPLFFFFPGKV